MKRICTLIVALMTASGLLWGQENTKEKPEGNPAENLPPHIKQVTWFGERPEWSHDGEKILFVARTFGDVYEYEIATGHIKPMTHHYKHYGYTRARYLANGDILLAGPDRPFDLTGRESRGEARSSCWFFVLPKDLSGPSVPLERMCSEGPAVSRDQMKIAWALTWHQRLDMLEEGQSQIFTAEVRYLEGKPYLTSQRLVFDSQVMPYEMHSLETQDFVPPDDEKLTVSVYMINNGVNTDAILLDLKTGKYTNLTNSPHWYDEPEGIFPDGKYTTTESAPSGGKPWPLIDIYKIPLDGSGEKTRMTYFTEYKGYRATQSVISTDGETMCFQIGKSGDEAGAGYGLFLFDISMWENSMKSK